MLTLITIAFDAGSASGWTPPKPSSEATFSGSCTVATPPKNIAKSSDDIMKNYAHAMPTIEPEAKSPRFPMENYAEPANDDAGEVKDDSSESIDTDDDEARCEAGTFYGAPALPPEETVPLSLANF